MEKQYRVVIIGFSHMHINDVAAHFYENPRTDLVAGADTIPLVPELKEGNLYPEMESWQILPHKF